jgi:hypothetical protein
LQAPADSDADGMPDAWETQYGLNPNSAADAGLDPDGDGFTNLQEYQRGSNPIVAEPAELTHNGSFEEAGTSASNAKYWVNGTPDNHGEMWGAALRTSWRAHAGAWEGVIRGTWANAGNFGGFWQEAPAVAGRTYRVSGWFWADSTWTAGAQKLKIEFLSGAAKGETYLKVVELNLGTIGQSWVQKTLEAVAPAGTTWARIVVEATGIQYHGALQFDELKLERVPVADADADGMPDAWETQYGLNPNSAADAALDPDGDGYTNLQEFQNGTNPTVAEPKKSSYTSLTAAGTFNGWNPAANNMTLVADYTWRATLNLVNATGVQFKFTANGNWNVNWGDNNQSDVTVPMTQTGERTGSNIRADGTLNGSYVLTFNEQSAQYTLQTAP